AEAAPDVEAAAAGCRVEVARRITVDTDLAPGRAPVARREKIVGRERELGDAGVAAPAARDPVRGRRLGAVRGARVTRRPVQRAVIALLVALEDAIAAALDLAGGGAAVAVRGVVVVALLADLDDAVATDRRVGQALEHHPVG